MLMLMLMLGKLWKTGAMVKGALMWNGSRLTWLPKCRFSRVSLVTCNSFTFFEVSEDFCSDLCCNHAASLWSAASLLPNLSPLASLLKQRESHPH